MNQTTSYECTTWPTVRRADGDDAPAIAALVNRAYRVESFFVDGDRTDEAEVRALLGAGVFLVLDHPGGDLAAAVYVELSGARGSFGLLSVDPDLQGSGLGRRLVGVVEAFCEAQECEVVELQVVNLRRELPPWYQSLGYRAAGTEPFTDAAKLSRPCHFIRMTKPLS